MKWEILNNYPVARKMLADLIYDATRIRPEDLIARQIAENVIGHLNSQQKINSNLMAALLGALGIGGVNIKTSKEGTKIKVSITPMELIEGNGKRRN